MATEEFSKTAFQILEIRKTLDKNNAVIKDLNRENSDIQEVAMNLLLKQGMTHCLSINWGIVKRSFNQIY